MFHSKLRRIILALVIVNVLAVVTMFVLAFLTLAAGEKDQDEILAAVVSPDQNYIAYVVAEEDPEVAINADIYIEDIRDTSRIRLTSEELVGSDVTWSPDSRKIAFVGRLRHIAGDGVGGVEAYRLKERAEDIYVVNTDGTKLRNLTHNEIQDFSPTWSPDSKQIAFVSDSNLCVINTVGSRVRCLAVDLSGFVALSWSPIGNTVALISHETIFFVDIDKGVLGNLGQGQNPYCLSWSPDGDRIAYVAPLSGKETDSLYVAESGNSNFRKLFSSDYALQCPAWSPDGQYIALSTIDKLYAIDSYTGVSKEIGKTSLPAAIFWSHDGEEVKIVDQFSKLQSFELNNQQN